MSARAFWPHCNDWNSYLCLKQAQKQQNATKQKNMEMLKSKIEKEREAPFAYLESVVMKTKDARDMRISFLNIDNNGNGHHHKTFDAPESFTLIFYMDASHVPQDPLKKFASTTNDKTKTKSFSTGNYASLRPYSLFVIDDASVSNGVLIDDVSMSDFTPENVSSVEVYVNDDIMVSRKKFAPLELVTLLLENNGTLVLPISVQRLVNANRIARERGMSTDFVRETDDRTNKNDIPSSTRELCSVSQMTPYEQSSGSQRAPYEQSSESEDLPKDVRVYTDMGKSFFQLKDGQWSVHDADTEMVLIGPFASKRELVNKLSII